MLRGKPSGIFLYSTVIIYICFTLCWKIKYDDDDDDDDVGLLFTSISLGTWVIYRRHQLNIRFMSFSRLPAHYRIQFKIATLTYKTLATSQPSYLYNLFQLHQPSRAFHSTQQLFQVPYMSTDFGRRAFSYSSLATWNSISTSIKNCSSLYSFKRHLKSYLIAQLINN